jgi:hypothetical protein
VVDTLYVNDTIYLPITQKHYSEKNVYDVRISGIEPQMDSIKTYPRTEYLTVEKLVEREKAVNKYEFYIGASLNLISRDFAPTIDFTLRTPRRVYYKANIGVCKGEMIYGVGVGFKLF